MVEVEAFLAWFSKKGGSFHQDARFVRGDLGHSIVAARSIPKDSVIVTCPFSLIITPDVCRVALSSVLDASDFLKSWSERQLLCCYICGHWIPSRTITSHKPYIDMLPAASQLRTPLHFSEVELQLLKGSNLYGATLDRTQAWIAEWDQCRQNISSFDPAYAAELTWERYLTASTHISSRAFPSTLLSSSPSLLHSPQSYPVLMPGVDALNHARAQPISWVVHSPTQSAQATSFSAISLQPHTAFIAGDEIYNNYGPKPNAELLLGYGFTIPSNPDDTIVLKIGGSDQKWEIGLSERNVEGLWREILEAVSAHQDEADIRTWETTLDAADTLRSMSMALFEKLPMLTGLGDGVRTDVAEMIRTYLEGQKAILVDLVNCASRHEQEAIGIAQAEGIELQLE